MLKIRCPKILPDPNQWPFFYGWVILFVGTLGILMTVPGQTIGVSTFTDSLLIVLKLSRDELSIAYMFGTMLSALLLTQAGKFFDRFGALRTALIASIGLGISLVYLSQLDRINSVFGSPKMLVIFLVLIGFVLIRFFGQGVLALASKTMIVKWFDRRRGLAVGISTVFIAFGFSLAPVFFDFLIKSYLWWGAWLFMGLILVFIFPNIIVLFFKNSPETYGLTPDDSEAFDKRVNGDQKFTVRKDFTLPETRSTLSFWVFTGFPALFGLFVTGFTFHVVSIFTVQDFSRDIAIGIFQPIAIVAVVTSILGGILSDFIELKYLAVLFGMAGVTATCGLSLMHELDYIYYVLVLGYGVCSGLHALILSVFLPRFFGKRYIGEITGFAMTIGVFASALGPMIFSQSLSLTGSYDWASYICGLIFVGLLVALIFTRNPQLEYTTSQ